MFYLKRCDEFPSREERLWDTKSVNRERVGFWAISRCGDTNHLFISCPVCGIITDMSDAGIERTGLFLHCIVCPCTARYDATLVGWKGGFKKGRDQIRDDGLEVGKL